MAASVNLQGNSTGLGNPYIVDVGKRASDAVIISSGFTSAGSTGSVQYQIRRQDQSPWAMDGTSVLNVYASNTTSELIRAISNTSLTIVLPFRQWFQVRTRQGTGAWSAWVAFKTRDKTYTLPDSITELRTTVAASTTGQTVTVTNSGKATVSNTSAGATITNNDLEDNDIISRRSLSTGYYIKKKTIETKTSTGVRIDAQS